MARCNNLGYILIGIFLMGMILGGVIGIKISDKILQKEISLLKEHLSLRYYCFDKGNEIKINSWDGASYRIITKNEYIPNKELDEYGLNISTCFNQDFMEKNNICNYTNIPNPIFEIFRQENCEVSP